MKRVPSYWWDFDGVNEVVVESDDDRFPVVARFTYCPKDGIGCAAGAIEQAMQLISDLDAGRVTPKAVP